MAQYSTRTYSWQDFIDDSVTWGDTNAWVSWTGNGTTIDGSTGFADLVFTGSTIDLGAVTTFLPIATADSTGTHSIAIQSSVLGDFSDAVTESVGAVTTRYVRFVTTVVNASAPAALNAFTSQLITDTQTETFVDLSVSASGTTLPISKNYSSIIGITYSAPHNREVILTDDTATAPVVTSYDIDTWGKVATATTATITIKGYPPVTTDSDGNIVIG